MAQGPESLRPILRLLQIMLRPLAFRDRIGVGLAPHRLDPLLGISYRELLAPNVMADGGKLLVETGGA